MINAIPENDEREHVEDVWCWCEPSFIECDDGEILVHNSADCRELVEQLTGEPMAPDKYWLVIPG